VLTFTAGEKPFSCPVCDHAFVSTQSNCPVSLSAFYINTAVADLSLRSQPELDVSCRTIARMTRAFFWNHTLSGSAFIRRAA
jgi:hypothetical protein